MTDTENKEVPFLLQKPSDPQSEQVKESLVQAINASEDMRKRALQYSAHLSKLLNEACFILEGLAVTIEVSEPLQCWWEREKRKKETKHVSKILSSSGDTVRPISGVGSGHSGLVSGSGTPINSEQETQPTSGKD